MCRIIPARAGFTPEPGRGTAHEPDHPRSRGVYGDYATSSHYTGGSSPLARGLLRRAPSFAVTRRIIPARAGFTFPLTTTSTCPTDHPRSRGVYDEHGDGLVGDTGSSPLARGLLGAAVPPLPGVRIIPARAGFTLASSGRYLSDPDHPRSRGVYQYGTVATRTGWGSSPLARGLRGPWGRSGGLLGIIPARAGFTTSTGGPAWGAPDHPRSRGVY